MNILVVDDEPKIVNIICTYLKKEGHVTSTSYDGLDAIEKFKKNEYQFVILDLMLPKQSGEEVCREIRKTSNVPIIMLTAKSQENSILNGFKLGADDYITKPFSPKELVARVNSILKRYNITDDENIFNFNNDDLKVNLSTFEIFKDDKSILFTPNEFKILELFIKNPKKIFTREDILEQITNDEFDIYDRTIDTHIKNMRSKIETNTKKPEYILTVYGVGYKFGGENDI